MFFQTHQDRIQRAGLQAGVAADIVSIFPILGIAKKLGHCLDGLG